jgi:hypothetical protein
MTLDFMLAITFMQELKGLAILKRISEERKIELINWKIWKTIRILGQLNRERKRQTYEIKLNEQAHQGFVSISLLPKV